MPGQKTKSFKAVIIGASGLIGKECLTLLLDHPCYTTIIALTRSRIEIEHPKFSQQVIDFLKLKEHIELLKPDVIFFCLGTTLRQAKTKEIFYQTDHDYAVQAGQGALSCHVEQFILVSALGANVNSAIFYNRVKGETERSLTNLGLKSLIILRPSLLTGKRNQNRPGEIIGKCILQLISPFLKGPLKKYLPISGQKVAQAMVKLSTLNYSGVRIFDSAELELV